VRNPSDWASRKAVGAIQMYEALGPSRGSSVTLGGTVISMLRGIWYSFALHAESVDG
jgi:hypothetical protein